MQDMSPYEARSHHVAAFDFDKTLTTRDCVVPFLRSFITPSKLASLLLNSHLLVSPLIRRNRDALKEVITLRVLGGIDQAVLEESARRYAAFILENWMREDMIAKLCWHKNEGHLTGIVSASYGTYVEPMGELLGVDFVIASELEIGRDRIATGRLIGGNCRGPEKARRLRSWLESNNLGESVIYAYGDSVGDRELLRMADHPHLVDKR